MTFEQAPDTTDNMREELSRMIRHYLPATIQQTPTAQNFRLDCCVMLCGMHFNDAALNGVQPLCERRRAPLHQVGACTTGKHTSTWSLVQVMNDYMVYMSNLTSSVYSWARPPCPNVLAAPKSSIVKRSWPPAKNRQRPHRWIHGNMACTRTS